MSSEPDNTATPPPSVFISYASGDRAAARLLGETLKRAGIDVWLDEEELAGGDAWDAKIRKQIRTCTFFMPVISATTEARREGYFRREWRLAVERTLDHADDVLFLTPVVIDDTRDQGARVPEKFSSVQWLRCPGGKETPQLIELARRLAAGPDEATNIAARPVPPPLAGARAKRAARRADDPKPPFVPFPAFPALGHRAHFLYEVLTWFGRTVIALWARLPRWLRYVAMIYIVFKLLSAIFSSNESKPARIQSAAEKIAAAKNLGTVFSGKDADKDEIAKKILEATGAAIDVFEGGRPLAIVTFTAVDTGAQQPALDAFSAVDERLKKAGHEKDVAIGAVPFAAGVDDAAILARAAGLKCHWLLVGTAQSAPGDEVTIEVRLFDANARKVIWQAQRSGDNDMAESLGDAIGRDLLKQVKFEAAAPAAPPTPPEPEKK